MDTLHMCDVIQSEYTGSAPGSNPALAHEG